MGELGGPKPVANGWSCVVERGRLLLSRGCDIGPPLGRCIYGASSVEVAPALKEEAEVGRRLSVMAAHAPPPRRLSAVKIALLVEQNPEVERGIAIPTQLRALIRRRRGSELTALIQQHAQVERTPGIPRLVSTAMRQLRLLRRRHWLLDAAGDPLRSRPRFGRRVHLADVTTVSQNPQTLQFRPGSPLRGIGVIGVPGG